jgi:integrase
MADIRKRTGSKGTTYQVRYPSKATKSGYAYATFETRKEALDFRENGSARKAASRRSSEIRTVAQGLQKWLDVCEKEGRDGRHPVTLFTLRHYQWRRDHILEYDWSKDLHELTPPDVVEFRGWLLRNFSHVVAHKLLSSFHSMVLELVRRGILPHDVAAGITIRGGSRYDEPVIIPTEAEVSSLLTAADRLANSRNKQTQKTWERYRPMLYLATDSGMRPQEYIILPEFNLTDEGVKVDRALEKGGVKISVTKTPAGRRYIELSPDTVAMVRHYSRTHGVAATLNTHQLAFPTKSGRWQSIDNWRSRGFAAACEEAGLMEMTLEAGEECWRPKFTPYSLRHFYASMLIEQRVNLKRIQSLMGHAKIETTLNVYGHLVERKEAEAEKRIGMLAGMREISCGKSAASPA